MASRISLQATFSVISASTPLSPSTNNIQSCFTFLLMIRQPPRTLLKVMQSVCSIFEPYSTSFSFFRVSSQWTAPQSLQDLFEKRISNDPTCLRGILPCSLFDIPQCNWTSRRLDFPQKFLLLALCSALHINDGRRVSTVSAACSWWSIREWSSYSMLQLLRKVSWVSYSLLAWWLSISIPLVLCIHLRYSL